MNASKVCEIKCVLPVGCGPSNVAPLDATLFPPAQWQVIRLDMDPEANSKNLASNTDMCMVDSNSVERLFSSHNREHLYSYDVPLAIWEFNRVLKPTGIAVIRVADLHVIAGIVSAGNLENALCTLPARPISPIDVPYGRCKRIQAGSKTRAHWTGFVLTSLTQKLAVARFRQIRANRGFF